MVQESSEIGEQRVDQTDFSEQERGWDKTRKEDSGLVDSQLRLLQDKATDGIAAHYPFLRPSDDEPCPLINAPESSKDKEKACLDSSDSKKINQMDMHQHRENILSMSLTDEASLFSRFYFWNDWSIVVSKSLLIFNESAFIKLDHCIDGGLRALILHTGRTSGQSRAGLGLGSVGSTNRQADNSPLVAPASKPASIVRSHSAIESGDIALASTAVPV
ncbi:unnamed protein product, partial [Protopolystoma xenopodis]